MILKSFEGCLVFRFFSDLFVNFILFIVCMNGDVFIGINLMVLYWGSIIFVLLIRFLGF